MRVVHKFPLQLIPMQHVDGQIEQVLTIQVQGDVPTMWAVVNDELPSDGITVSMTGTGKNDYEILSMNKAHYVNTTQLGGLVWHWFVSGAPLHG